MPNLSTNTELIEACVRNYIPINYVVYKDQLQDMPVKQGAYIINLANSTDKNGGTHWVCFWIEKKKCVYFDPFGIHPPESVVKYTQRFQSMMSSKQIQNEYSGICGYFVLYFLWYMTHTRRQQPDPFKRAEEFNSLFSSDPKDNLELLKCYLKNVK